MRIIRLVCKFMRDSDVDNQLQSGGSPAVRRAAVCMRYIDPRLHRSIIGDILENVPGKLKRRYRHLKLPVQRTIFIFPWERLMRFNF